MNQEIGSVLVVGGGAREYGYLWKLRKDDPELLLYAAPGNGGISSFAEIATASLKGIDVPINPVDTRGIMDLLKFAEKHRVGLTVVGPETPLAAGLADVFEHYGQPVFGPSCVGAMIESSKYWSNWLLEKYNIPRARGIGCNSLDQAEQAIDELGPSVVVKPDGLTAGKGVGVFQTIKQAKAYLKEVMVEKIFGTAGGRVVIQEYLEAGEYMGDIGELSVMAFVDGTTIVPMVPARDYKLLRPKLRGDRRKNPNTGGMGAFSGPSLDNPPLLAQITQEILEPIMAALKAEGRPYRGILYAGLMLTKYGPKVLEINCRGGDPEIPAIIPRLQSNLSRIFDAVRKGELTPEMVSWSNDYTCAVVVASEGYPGDYVTGCPIDIDELEEGELIFHAGTAIKDGQLVTAAGRVADAIYKAKTLAEARRGAYNIAEEKIHYSGKIMHPDVGLAA